MALVYVLFSLFLATLDGTSSLLADDSSNLQVAINVPRYNTNGQVVKSVDSKP